MRADACLTNSNQKQAKTYFSLFLFLRRQYHDHLTTFHLWKLLDLAIRFQISLQTLQHTHADFLMRHFTTTETQCDFSLVAIIQELGQITQFDIVITIICTRTELDFLDQNDFLLQLGFVSFLLLLVFELAVVHQTANWRLRRRRYFHQINIGLFRQAEGFTQFYDAQRLVLNAG